MSKENKTSGVRQVQVSEDRSGQRLDNFLSSQLRGVPRSAVYRLIRTGQVRINGKRCKAGSRVQEGDQVRIPPVMTRERGAVVIPERALGQLERAILYEDDDLLVIDKPVGMAVHSGSQLPWGLIDVARKIRPDGPLELAHRLDRETSGCLVLARGHRALGHVSEQFREGTAGKEYLCLMDGHLREAVVEVDAPLQKQGQGDRQRVVVDPAGKAARTRFSLLQAFRDASYVRADLLTGRTHQIRAHACHLDLPLAGDERYAPTESFRRWKRRGLKRLFLHASRLSLKSPSGETMTFSAPLPDSLRSVLDSLETERA